MWKTLPPEHDNADSAGAPLPSDQPDRLQSTKGAPCLGRRQATGRGQRSDGDAGRAIVEAVEQNEEDRFAAPRKIRQDTRPASSLLSVCVCVCLP